MVHVMGQEDVYPLRTSNVGCLLQYVVAYLGRPYWIYIIPTHDMHQWLLQFLVLLMMDAESVRNMYSDLAVTNKQYQSCILLVLYII